MKYLADFVIELDSPLHIGTGRDTAVTDAPAFRDAFDLYRIPGTSLAGVLRAAVRDSAAGEEAAQRIFGTIEDEDENPRGSRLMVSDGYLLDWDNTVALSKVMNGREPRFPLNPIIQDCVCLEPETGTAREGGKFDLEIVPQGTRFAARLEYAPQDSDSLDVLKQLMVDLQQGNLQVGGCTTRGLGYFHAQQVKLYSCDDTTPEGLDAWRRRPHRFLEDPPDALSRVDLPDGGLHSTHHARGISGSVRITFRTDGPLLVGGNQAPFTDEDVDADLTFAEYPVANYENGELEYRLTVPGASLKGVLRHRAYHALRCLDVGEIDKTLGELFGRVEGDDARQSKVRVRGCTLEADRSACTVVPHVAIDRLTGGALDGALYSEAPLWQDGTPVPVELRVDDLSDAEAALLLHSLLDLGRGRAPIGGGTRRGSGTLRFADGDFYGADVRFSLHRNGRSFNHQSSRRELQELLDTVSGAFSEEFAERTPSDENM